MNEVFTDHVRQYFDYTNDVDLMRKVFPVLKGIVEWEIGVCNRIGTVPLYENSLDTWISDSHWYIRGQCTTASAYMLGAHRLLATLAEALGEDPTPYRQKAESIHHAMQQKLWQPRRGVFAEYLDTLGAKQLHPEPELATIYHTAEFGAASPLQIYEMLHWVDNNLRHESDSGGGKACWGSNWFFEMSKTCSKSEKNMNYRKLGSTGIDVSVVGFGAWAIGGWMWGGTDEEQAVQAIHAALDHGINLIDTAPAYGYGRSEAIIARAIEGRREKAVLATKCGLIWDGKEGEFFFHADRSGITAHRSETSVYKCLRPDSIRKELDRSLTRLKTTYIDLYQTHWQESTTPITDTMATLLKLKEQGKIRAIGVSNANLDQLKAYGPVNSDQEKYSMLDREIERNGNLDYCCRQNIAVLAYSPLANGLLTGKIRPERQFGVGDLRRDNHRFTPANIERINATLKRLRPIAERHRATIAQLAIAWTCVRSRE